MLCAAIDEIGCNITKLDGYDDWAKVDGAATAEGNSGTGPGPTAGSAGEKCQDFDFSELPIES